MDPRHLEEDAPRTYRKTFARRRRLVVPHFLRRDVADRCHQFLAHEAEYRRTYGLYSVSGHETSEQHWREAEESDRFYSIGRLAGAQPEFQLSANAVHYLKLRSAVRDPRFGVFLEQITGIPLSGLANPHVNAFEVGDCLKVHNDAVGPRRLAIIFYLSRDWRSDFGGALHMLNEDGSEEKIEAEYNSFVVFDVTVSSRHYIAPIEAAAGDRSRLTLSVWGHGVCASASSR